MLALSRSLSLHLRLASATTLPLSALPPSAALHTSSVLDRARKGTRERKRKVVLANIKKKQERLRKNPPKLPAVMIKMLYERYGIVGGKPRPLRADESEVGFPTDDVWHHYKHCYPRHPFERAVHELRCHYHPSLLDRADDAVFARVELNMNAVKKEKYLEDFTKMVPVIHPFGTFAATKNVCAFVGTKEEEEKAKEAGAFMAGGEDLIKEIVKGRVELADIDHFLCHDDLLLQMKPLAGLLRDKTPQKLQGTVGDDIPKMVRTFRSGIVVNVKKPVPSLLVAKEPDFGYCEVPLGYLSQDPQLMKENLDMLLETLQENRPKREHGGWITRVTLQLEDGHQAAKFSITHPLIDDAKLKQHLDNIEKETGKKKQKTKTDESEASV